MAFTTLEYVYSGQASFPLPFPLGIISREYVTIQINAATDGTGEPLYYTDFVWVSDAEIQINGLSSGDNINIRLTMPKTQLVSPFSEGSDITRRNLDRQSKQLLIAYHEILDGRLDFPELVTELISGLDFNEIRDEVIDSLSDTVYSHTVRLSDYVGNITGDHTVPFQAALVEAISNSVPLVVDVSVQIGQITTSGNLTMRTYNDAVISPIDNFISGWEHSGNVDWWGIGFDGLDLALEPTAITHMFNQTSGSIRWVGGTIRNWNMDRGGPNSRPFNWEYACDGGVITDLRVNNMRGSNVLTVQCPNLTISDSIFRDIDYHVLRFGAYSDNITFDVNGDWVSIQHCDNITVRNCKFYNVEGVCTLFETGTRYGQVVGCLSDNCLQLFKADNSSDGTIIRNRHINPKPGNNATQAIQLDVSQIGTNLANPDDGIAPARFNICFNYLECSEDGINGFHSDTFIIGNTIKGFIAGKKGIAALKQLPGNPPSNCTISQNTLIGEGRGLDLDGTYLLVTLNYIVCGEEAITHAGGKVVIQNNLKLNTTTSTSRTVRLISTSIGSIVRDNDFTGTASSNAAGQEVIARSADDIVYGNLADPTGVKYSLSDGSTTG